MLQKQIQAAIRDQRLLCIYTNREDTSRFLCGTALRADEEQVLFACVSPQGEYDGFAVKDLDDIFMIGQDNRYTHKIEKLMRVHNPVWESVPDDGTVIQSLLRFAEKHGKIVSIQLLNSGFTDAVGFVKKADPETVVLQSVDEYGDPDGETVLDTACITAVSCDDEEEQALMILTDRIAKK